MLNREITEQTPMTEVLQKTKPEWTAQLENDELNAAALDLIQEMINMQIIYRAAIKEVTTRLEILNEEFQHNHEHNPIHTIKNRIKNPKSIVEKLGRRGWALDVDTAREKLTDIAGVRIICPYIEDIYTIKTMLLAQDDINVLIIRDYIAEPKPNGYRSLHLIVEVPVYFSSHKQYVKVEIQIRTIAMDFWASLEHQLRYKSEDNHVSTKVIAELKECADTIASTDQKMQDIHNQIIS